MHKLVGAADTLEEMTSMGIIEKMDKMERKCVHAPEPEAEKNMLKPCSQPEDQSNEQPGDQSEAQPEAQSQTHPEAWPDKHADKEANKHTNEHAEA